MSDDPDFAARITSRPDGKDEMGYGLLVGVVRIDVSSVKYHRIAFVELLDDLLA
jgi:hypothetical protein